LAVAFAFALALPCSIVLCLCLIVILFAVCQLSPNTQISNFPKPSPMLCAQSPPKFQVEEPRPPPWCRMGKKTSGVQEKSGPPPGEKGGEIFIRAPERGNRPPPGPRGKFPDPPPQCLGKVQRPNSGKAQTPPCPTGKFNLGTGENGQNPTVKMEICIFSKRNNAEIQTPPLSHCGAHIPKIPSPKLGLQVLAPTDWRDRDCRIIPPRYTHIHTQMCVPN
jgi:hypothetical protein